MNDYDIGLGKYYCTDCDWIGEFAKLTDKSRDTDSLVECPDCGSVNLEIGGGS